MVDKNLSMSSFLALRYTEKLGVDFTKKLSYRHPTLPKESERILVHTAQDIGESIEHQLQSVRGGGTRRQAYYFPVAWIRLFWHPTYPVVTHTHSAF